MASLDDEELYCSCRMPYDSSLFMIQCDVCNEWYHGRCVGIKEYQAGDVDQFHCPSCQKVHGPSTLKQKKNFHRHDYFEDGASTARAVQSGSVMFIDQLKQRKFPSAGTVVKRMKGYQLTTELLEKNGFKLPVLVEDSSGLDLTVPSTSFTVRDVERHVGGEKIVDVIDVEKQTDLKMTMHEWAEYFCTRPRSKILNVISLEFSDTALSPFVLPPRIVLELSWVYNYWPPPTSDDPHRKPEVQKYCLMSAKDSYTDFHIDFGGTSVWYHVLWGEKVFYLIEPSATALAAFEAWSTASDQSEVFFGDRVDRCYELVLKGGQTLFIPTGWIHAVYTPVDSLVFGGNFLHSLNVALQFRVNDMEQRIDLPSRFRFPNFETTCWYAARNIADTLKETVEESKKPPRYLCKSAKELMLKLKAWMQPKDASLALAHKKAVPDGLQAGKVLRDLAAVLSEITEGCSPKPKLTSPKKKHAKLLAAPAAGKRDDKLTADLNVLEKHTYQALKESEESVAIKVKVAKKPNILNDRQCTSGGEPVDSDCSGDGSRLTIDDNGAASADDAKTLKLKLNLPEKTVRSATVSWNQKQSRSAVGSHGVLQPPDATRVVQGLTDVGAAGLLALGEAASRELQSPLIIGREAGSLRRQGSADAPAAARAYTRDDYVYPSVADSDGEDGFTVKSRSGKKRPNADDAWYPSTKVKPLPRPGLEPGQAEADAGRRPVRSSTSATQNRGNVRWPGAGSDDDDDENGGQHSPNSEELLARGSNLDPRETARSKQPARPIVSVTADVSGKKIKKGLATTKQRLSKILKLGQSAHS